VISAIVLIAHLHLASTGTTPMSQTIVFQPPKGQADDCSVMELLPDEVLGANVALYVIRATGDRYRTMIGFDLTGSSYGIDGIPRGSRIVSAKLTFNCLEAPVVATTVAVHMVKKEFTIVSTETTWNSASAEVPWITPGGDYDRTAAVTFASPIDTGDFDVTGLAAAVQEALDENDGNATFLLKFDDESGIPRGLGMFSSESTFDPDPRMPRLTVVYQPRSHVPIDPPTPATDAEDVRDVAIDLGWGPEIGDDRAWQDGRPASP